MKKRKVLFISLLATSLIALSGCQQIKTLFNDDDLSISNSFNSVISIPKSNSTDGIYAGGVMAKEISEVPDAYCFKNIGYAKNESIVNTYKEGGVNHKEYNVNNNEDYSANKS